MNNTNLTDDEIGDGPPMRGDEHMLRKIFGKKDRFDDEAKIQFAKTVAEMLEIQKTVAAGKSIEDDQGQLKRKALAYVYGYIDAALRAKGHGMADMSIGVIAFQVIRRLWPDHVNKCMDYLIRNIKSDALMNAGTADSSSLTTQSMERPECLWASPAL